MSVLVAKHQEFNPSTKLDLVVEPFLVNNYSASDFNGMIHGKVASKIYLEDQVQRLGAIIVEHGLEEAVGVWRVHKHFDLTDGERVVGRFTNDSLIDVKVESTSGENQDDCVPTHYKFEADGSATPMQFMEKGGNLGSILSEKINSAFSEKPEFLPEFAALINALGVHDRLGLALRWEFALKDQCPGGVMENTMDGERTQTLFPLQLEENVWSGNTTMWTFEKGLGGAVVKKLNCSCGHTKLHC